MTEIIALGGYMLLIPPVIMHRSQEQASRDLGTVGKAGTAVSREFATLLSSAFGLMAALAWSDAVKGAFEKLGAFREWRVVGPFVFAAVVTLAALLVTRLLAGFAKPACTKLCDD